MLMRNLWIALLPMLLAGACGPGETGPEEVADVTPEATPADSDSEQTHLGGCILLSPAGDVPEDLYQVTDVMATDEYPPFTKKLVVYGLTLVARDDASDDFMRLVARTIQENFPQGEGIDGERQAEILRNHYRYRALIPVPKGEDFSFDEDPRFEEVASQNTVCDIIMEGVRGQVMEVVEHILHYVTDVGLHYTFPDEWGISDTSVLRLAMDDSIEKGYYNVEQYSDIDDDSDRDRVLMQEFAYWVISTAWNLQEDYGPNEEEWTIRNAAELKEKLPDLFAAYERTVATTMAAASIETIREIGPTRAEEREAEGGE